MQDDLANKEPNDFYINFILERRQYYSERLKDTTVDFKVRNCKKAIKNCDSMLEKMKETHPEYFI